MMRTANPALNSTTFNNLPSAASQSESMTIQGTVNKTGILLLVLVSAAAFVWQKAALNPASVTGLVMLGGVGGLITALVTVFKKHLAGVTAPIYAVCEGLALGGISAIFEMQYPGIVFQAVGLTFGTLFALLGAYTSGYIKATENFKLGVVAATGGIMVVYLISFILGLFGMPIGFIHSSGPFGILFSLGVVVVAALNLVLDFDFIEHGAQQGAPKYMEWYASFGLLVTLVWLYVEILRLLSKLRDRR